MTIKVEEVSGGIITITWDPNDPVESIMNTWTEEKFKEELKAYAKQFLQKDTFTSVT